MMTSQAAAMTPSQLVAPSDHALALRSAALRVDACAGLGRVVLEQCFANSYDEPLHVTYRLPLPADAAVSGFRFHVGERVIEGEIDRRDDARERFEQAVASGHSAALLEQQRSSLFEQEIGNVPPHAEVRCEIVLDQRLRWLDEGMWEWRFPLAAAPRYLGEPGRVRDAGMLALAVGERLEARASLVMAVRDGLRAGGSPESPSHPLWCVADGAGFAVTLGAGNAAQLDRDLVVRWPVADDAIRASVDFAGARASSPDAHALVCLVPPASEAAMAALPRDVTVLLDTSGSMGGPPLEQAKAVVVALLDGLAEQDSFELIEFSWRPRRFRRGRLAGTAANKRAAVAWVRALAAGGGTEMRSGILEALEPLDAERQHQVVLVTDGLVGFEQEIVAKVLELLPHGARLHTVGVGSAVNRSLTGPAARAGRGVEVVLGLGEDPAQAAARLCARTVAPLVVGLEVSGSALLEAVPARLPDLYAGAPVLLSLRLRAGGGELVVRGKTAAGGWEQRHVLGAAEAGSGSDAVVTLFGREAVEDAEMRLGAGAEAQAIDAEIERLGLAYRVATRLTSWVAIDSQPSVDPRSPTRRERVPQALPYGTSIEGLGLRRAAMTPTGTTSGILYASALAAAPAAFGARLITAKPRMSPSRGKMAIAAAPPAQRSPAKEKSRLRRMADALLGELPGRRAPTPVELPEMAFADDEAKPAVVRLQGRIVSRKGRRLVLEIELDAPLDWQPAGVSLRFAGLARSVAAEIEWERTTRPGSLAAGITLRLVVELGEDPPAQAPELVELVSGSLALEIVL
jgi:Ca-activated chloride channel homolog